MKSANYGTWNEKKKALSNASDRFMEFRLFSDLLGYPLTSVFPKAKDDSENKNANNEGENICLTYSGFRVLVHGKIGFHQR